jgi:uncharacterized protein GlcG (DUF336 family)
MANRKVSVWKYVILETDVVVNGDMGLVCTIQRVSVVLKTGDAKRLSAATFRRPTKVFEDGVNLMHLNYLLAFDAVIASRAGIPLIEHGMIIGAIGCSGGTDSQDEVVSEAGAAVINK